MAYYKWLQHQWQGDRLLKLKQNCWNLDSMAWVYYCTRAATTERLRLDGFNDSRNLLHGSGGFGSRIGCWPELIPSEDGERGSVPSL